MKQETTTTTAPESQNLGAMRTALLAAREEIVRRSVSIDMPTALLSEIDAALSAGIGEKPTSFLPWHITLTDEEAQRIGRAIAIDFELRRSWEHPDRFETVGGTFTAIGIARRAVRHLEDGTPAALALIPFLLQTLQNIHANAAESVDWIRRHCDNALAMAKEVQS